MAEGVFVETMEALYGFVVGDKKVSYSCACGNIGGIGKVLVSSLAILYFEQDGGAI